MKTIILAAFILAASTSFSQFNLNLGAGMNTTIKKPAAELSVGYDAKLIFVQAGFLANMARDIQAGAVFNARMGHTVRISETFSLQPSAGYAYNLRSNERKELNVSGMIGSLYVIKETSVPQLQLFAGGNVSKKSTIFSVGIRFVAVGE